MFGSVGASTFSVGKVVGGISKTLGIVNQIIPLYKEAKPMITNARNAMNFIKEFSKTSTNRITTNTEKNIKPIKEKINNLVIDSKPSKDKGPTFFL